VEMTIVRRRSFSCSCIFFLCSCIDIIFLSPDGLMYFVLFFLCTHGLMFFSYIGIDLYLVVKV